MGCRLSLCAGSETLQGTVYDSLGIWELQLTGPCSREATGTAFPRRAEDQSLQVTRLLENPHVTQLEPSRVVNPLRSPWS